MNSNIYRTALAAMRKRAAFTAPSGLVQRAARSVLGYPIGAWAAQALSNKNNKQPQPALQHETGHGQPNPPVPQQPALKDEQWHSGIGGQPESVQYPQRQSTTAQPQTPIDKRWLLDQIKLNGIPAGLGAPAYLKQRLQDQYRPRLPKTV
jgi:hypothetical protein